MHHEELLDAENVVVSNRVNPWKVGAIAGVLGFVIFVGAIMALLASKTFIPGSENIAILLGLYLSPLLAMLLVLFRNSGERLRNDILVSGGTAYTIVAFLALTLSVFSSEHMLIFAHNITGNSFGIVFFYGASLIGFLPLAVVGIILKSFKQ